MASTAGALAFDAAARQELGPSGVEVQREVPRPVCCVDDAGPQLLVAVLSQDLNGLVEAEGRQADLQRPPQPRRSDAGNHPMGHLLVQTTTWPPAAMAWRAAVQARVWSVVDHTGTIGGPASASTSRRTWRRSMYGRGRRSGKPAAGCARTSNATDSLVIQRC
jgi:hypothetical protein